MNCVVSTQHFAQPRCWRRREEPQQSQCIVDDDNARVPEVRPCSIHGAHDRREFRGRPHIVVVQKRNPCSPCGFDAGIASRSYAAVGRVADHPDPRILKGRRLRRRRIRAIVDDHHFDTHTLLTQRGPESPASKLVPPIQGRDDDGNLGLALRQGT
jgi:hypothetical protein